MDRRYILAILAAALAGFVGVMLLMPPTADDGAPRLPWQTSLDQKGRTQAFGFTLGQSTLADVRRTLGEDGTVNLFFDPGRAEPLAAEAFFEQVYLQSLRADFVVALDVDQQTLRGMYDRGLRISKTESGAKRVKLDPADSDQLAARPLRSIAYLPQAKLPEQLLERRFGKPDERRIEPKTGIAHWLYPNRGIEIARDPTGKAVIQYVNPSDFSVILAPLKNLPQPGAGNGSG